MADVFLSYAREDLSFVRRLTAALQTRNRNVWVDLEGIIPSAHWMEEIRRAVTEADAVVFVISPDSVVSKVCQTELNYAAEASKRLVPILARKVRIDEVPSALTELHWLSFLDGTDFDVSVDRLVEVLDTDLDRTHMHTIVLIRTREWEKRDRDHSLLLRGNELKEAETWLANQTGRQPAATHGQAQLILASRRAATSRQRDFALTGAVVAIVMAVLATVAFIQRQTAIYQREVAEDQKELAIVRELVLQAENRRGSDVGLALRLGIAAYRIRPIDETQRSLNTTLTNTRLTTTITGHAGLVRSVAFSFDGHTLATASEDKTATLWDISDRAHPFRTATLPHADAVYGVVFSPDGHSLATISQNSAAKLWDITDRVHPKHITTLGNATITHSLTFSRDGRTVATSNYNTAELWDITDRAHPTHAATLTVENGHLVQDVALSPDGLTLGITSTGQHQPPGTATELWDITDHAHPARIAALAGPMWSIYPMAFSPDGHTLATATLDDLEGLWDITDRVHPSRTAIIGGAAPVAFSLDGHTLATDRELWDITDRTHPTRAATISGKGTVAFSPDGHVVGTARDDNTVQLWDVTDWAHPGHTATVGDDNISSYSVAFSSDGRVLAAPTDNTHSVGLWDITDRAHPTLASTVSHIGIVYGAAFSPDRRTLIATSSDETARLWDVTDLAHPALITTLGHIGLLQAVVFSQDGHTLVALSDGAVGLWDITDRTHPTRTATIGGETPVAFSPDGHTLAAINKDGAGLWDITDRTHPTRTATLQYPNLNKSAGAVAFSPDAHTLATTSNDTAQLWNITDRARPTLITTFRPGSFADYYANTVYGVAFSRDGHALATGSADHTVGLWDITDSAHPTRTATLHNDDSVVGVTFSPDGYTLATASRTTVLWDVREILRLSGHLVELSCAAAGGGLTQEQWNVLVTGISYRPTC